MKAKPQRQTTIHFSFIVPIKGLCCKPKYRANIIHHFILFSVFIFSTTQESAFDMFVSGEGKRRNEFAEWHVARLAE